MENVYEKLKAEALADLERYNNSQVIEDALSITLHNESEETDYGLWAEGCKQFAADNLEALKEWVH